MRDAAWRAVKDPQVWVPAASAVVFSSTKLDLKVSEWAYENTPIFGSPEDAARASDDLRALACTSSVFAAAAIPNKQGFTGEGLTTAKGVTVGLAVGFSNSEATGYLKDSTDKERPNGNDSESFPSSHTSQAFACSTAASRNLDAVPIAKSTRKGLRLPLLAISAATAWSRIESHDHYPSDVLFGAALGTFITNLIYNAFFGDAEPTEERTTNSNLSIDLTDNAIRLNYTWSF